MMASGMPFEIVGRCWGPASRVAFGKATPLTLTVVGIDVGDRHEGGRRASSTPKTKICRVAGVVALIENGANGVPTPICVVTVLATRNRDGDEPALDDLAPPARSVGRGSE